jgi:aminoglycoside phosphotransferase (APT) family kinase protein
MGVGTAVGSGLEPLARFLHTSIYPDADSVEVTGLDRSSGGASWETFFVSLAVRAGGAARREQVVIKRAPDFGPMAPYEIRKDVVIFEALEGSDVPAPHLLAHTEDRSVFERPFTVTSLIEGESDDITKVERWPTWQEHREELGWAIVDVAAALNRFHWQHTDVASVMGAPGSAAARVAWMVDRYLEPLLERSALGDIPQAFCRDVGLWLKENVHEIPEDELSIVHGDFRFGNFLWQGTKLVGVVDWERAMLGDPMSNLGFFCMPLSRRVRPELMGKALTFEQMADRYERHNAMVLDRARLHYYMIFWQFFEGVNGTRSITEIALGASNARVASSGLLSPNLIARQTLELINEFDRGNHDVWPRG